MTDITWRIENRGTLTDHISDHYHIIEYPDGECWVYDAAGNCLDTELTLQRAKLRVEQGGFYE